MFIGSDAGKSHWPARGRVPSIKRLASHFYAHIFFVLISMYSREIHSKYLCSPVCFSQPYATLRRKLIKHVGAEAEIKLKMSNYFCKYNNINLRMFLRFLK